jgi:general stress protein 26
LSSPAGAQPGNGLLLFFRVDDFGEALNRARALVPRLDEEPHRNPSTETPEFSLRDPDGYHVTISALSGDVAPLEGTPMELANTRVLLNVHDADLADSHFAKTRLTNASFDDVNLRASQFTNVNLHDARFRDVNLQGVTIEDANLKGMTIDGVAVTDLLRSAHDAAISKPRLPLSPAELLSFMRAQPWAVEASVNARGAPQAAVIGVAVTDRWELLFDTVTQSRKHQNLVQNPRVAVVIGWEHECTVQYEGIAEIPTDAELPGVQAAYFDRFPDGPTRQSWPGIVYWRVKPTWIRYSDFNANPPIIQEWDAAAITGWLT